MKRSGPMKRRAGLKRGDSQLERTRLNPRSEKRQKLMRDDRVPLITALVEAGVTCEIGPVLEHYDVPGRPTCRRKIEGMHERRKRSAGGSLTNRKNLIPACNACNGAVEDNPRVVRELTGSTLVVRSGDPEWDLLGARQDREETDTDASE